MDNTTVSLLLSLNYNGIISLERYTEAFRLKVNECVEQRTLSPYKSSNMDKRRLKSICDYFEVFRKNIDNPNVDLTYIFKSFIESKDVLSNLDSLIEKNKGFNNIINNAKELKAFIENHQKLSSKKNYKP